MVARWLRIQFLGSSESDLVHDEKMKPSQESRYSNRARVASGACDICGVEVNSASGNTLPQI